jgi:hypothetical protein
MQWNLLTAKKHLINVNGHEVEGTVTVQWAYEDVLPVAGEDFDFGDANENEAYAERFNPRRHDLVNVMVSVIVRAEGMEGIDHLGACHVALKTFETDLMGIVDCHGMVDNATAECQKEIMEGAKRLVKYSEAV